MAGVVVEDGLLGQPHPLGHLGLLEAGAGDDGVDQPSDGPLVGDDPDPVGSRGRGGGRVRGEGDNHEGEGRDSWPGGVRVRLSRKCLTEINASIIPYLFIKVNILLPYLQR